MSSPAPWTTSKKRAYEEDEEEEQQPQQPQPYYAVDEQNSDDDDEDDEVEQVVDPNYGLQTIQPNEQDFQQALESDEEAVYLEQGQPLDSSDEDQIIDQTTQDYEDIGDESGDDDDEEDEKGFYEQDEGGFSDEDNSQDETFQGGVDYTGQQNVAGGEEEDF